MSSKSLVPLHDLLHCSTTAKDWASKLWTQYGVKRQGGPRGVQRAADRGAGDLGEAYHVQGHGAPASLR